MIATASDGRVRLRTAQPAEAIAALTREGATVAATGPDEITIQALSAERLVAILTSAGIPFPRSALIGRPWKRPTWN